jgi:hypothetical protein
MMKIHAGRSLAFSEIGSVSKEAAQDSVFFIHKNAAQRVLVAENEIGDWVNARRRRRLTSNLKIDTSTTTRTSPRRDLGKLKLPQKRGRFRTTMFEHPAHKSPFVIRQQLWLNSDEPEERPANDGTYRPIMKKVPPGKIVSIPLAPATIFEGVVLLGDTDMPAANSVVKMWASQQEFGGSMLWMDGKTDDRGRFD